MTNTIFQQRLNYMTTNFKINSFRNLSSGKDINILHDIRRDEINISIYQRKIKHLGEEIMYFLNQDIQLKIQGTSENIIEQFKSYCIKEGFLESHLLSDFSTLLHLFEEISKATHFKVFFSTIETDMCRRFHTDVNVLRLLCTYHGPATLWLPEEAENRTAYHSGENNKEIIQSPTLVQQANTGDVLILKGALYPNAKAVIHRSPSIEKNKVKRLLLRIDINK